jgi:type III pantothenate kinase
MNPAVVVDIGNTRIKWGRCTPAGIAATVSLPPADPGAWLRQLREWGLPPRSAWVLTSVQPARCAELAKWLAQQDQAVTLIDEARLLPLRVELEKPDHVGIDRLLDAVAVNQRRPAGVGAVIVDAGSAITVDWVDENGAFQGGAILPGMRLMSEALHLYTALLPRVPVPQKIPPLPGKATPAAIEVGIYWAAAGGIRGLIDAYRAQADREPVVFLTGGDTEFLAPALPGATPWPGMTLEGIRLSALALP